MELCSESAQAESYLWLLAMVSANDSKRDTFRIDKKGDFMKQL